MSDALPAVASWRQRLRDSRLLMLFEFAAVAAVFVADQYHHIYFSKTPYLLALGWLSMAIRGVRWRDVGLRLSPRWMRLVLYGIVAGVAMEALELFVTQPLLVSLTGNLPDLSVFHPLIGNVGLLLLSVALSWVGGLGEELVWRGYVLNRAADFFGHNPLGWGIALIAVNVAFGFAHSYQDITGVVENAIAGLLLGLLYLASGRNLIVPIIAHSLGDSIDFLLIFSSHYPGMR